MSYLAVAVFPLVGLAQPTVLSSAPVGVAGGQLRGTALLSVSHVHRGGGKAEAPDNTLETFLWRCRHGSAVECDCRKTKDGIGIMLHDDCLMRTGRGIPPELATNSVTIPAAALDPKGGHVQGIAVGDGAVYVSQMTQLMKLDWNGKVLATNRVVSHTGDIAWSNGELYTAVAVYPAGKEGRIIVYDQNLKPVRETAIDRAIDGITCLDGVLYVGMGAGEQPSKNPHRVNILGRFDAKTLKEIAPRQEFDYGYKTKYGFQDMATDGKLVYATFYSGQKGAPIMAAFDRDGKVVGTANAGSNQGFDILPDDSVMLVHRKGFCSVEPLPELADVNVKTGR